MSDKLLTVRGRDFFHVLKLIETELDVPVNGYVTERPYFTGMFRGGKNEQKIGGNSHGPDLFFFTLPHPLLIRIFR